MRHTSRFTLTNILFYMFHLYLLNSLLFSSPSFTTIGFQGPDPSTDFRGGGLFSLQNLLYFIHTNKECFNRFIKQNDKIKLNKNNNNKEDYTYYLPWACCGINITHALTNLLSLHSHPSSLLSSSSYSIYTSFLTLLEYEEYAFEEIYSSMFCYIEEIWREERIEYRQFNEVLNRVKQRVIDVLLSNPINIHEFHQAMTEKHIAEHLK